LFEAWHLVGHQVSRFEVTVKARVLLQAFEGISQALAKSFQRARRLP